LVGVSDHARNQLIQLLAARSAHSPRPTPYSFDSAIGRPKQIVVDSKWLVFLQSNHLPLRAFAQFSVARYLEARNPGIPGIINKLERPGMRKLVPFSALCVATSPASPLKRGEQVEVIGMLDDERDEPGEIFVKIRWRRRQMGVPLAHLEGVNVGPESAQAVADWHYWCSRGYRF
jgi:hypothetical protein